MPNKTIELPVVTNPPEDYDDIEEAIALFFKTEIYLPLIADLGLNPNKVLNSMNDLISAIVKGRIQFDKGKFTGNFSTATSRELKKLGAKWKSGTWNIYQSKLPIEVQNAVRASETRFTRAIKKVDARLAQGVPDTITERLNLEDLFDKTLYKVGKRVATNIKHLTVSPELTPERRRVIAEEYTNNIKLYITEFTQKQTAELRKKIQAQTFTGNRYEGLIKTIQDSYGVSARKAKFLARNETNILLAKYKANRYQDAGVTHYKWRCVTGTPLHPVRPMHRELNNRSVKGEVFRFDQPPIDTPDGSSHNPGENYNCFPGSTRVRLDRFINKIFRRRYTGKLALLIGTDGVILEATGNHPVLTNRGWISAKDVHIGDNVFQTVSKDRFAEEVNSEYVESRFDKVFNALRVCSEIVQTSASPTDFHGDVFEEKDIDIITIDSVLSMHRISQLYKMLREVIPQPTNTPASALSSVAKSVEAWGLTPERFVSFLGELETFLARHIAHSNKISGGYASPRDSAIFNPSCNRGSADFIFDGDCKFTNPFLIILNSIFVHRLSIPRFESAGTNDFNSSSPEALADNISTYSNSITDFNNSKIGRFINPLRIVDKQFRNFSGHVYNLETKSGWYFAENLIVKNCRCTAVPVVRF